MNKLNRFLCSILGHVFKENEIDLTKENTCYRCNHEVKLTQSSVAVPNYGCK